MEGWRCRNNLSLNVLSLLTPRQLMCHEQFCSRWFGLKRAQILFKTTAL